jgi:hypothetical protein
LALLILALRFGILGIFKIINGIDRYFSGKLFVAIYAATSASYQELHVHFSQM